MLDIGWSELVLIGVVALIVVGPKDLPEMFRTLGRLTAKARMMARDFQRAMEDAADDSGLKDITRDLNSIRSPVQTSLDSVNRKLDEWDSRARSARAGAQSPPPDAVPAPVVETPAAAASVAEVPQPDPAVDPAPPTPAVASAGPVPPAPVVVSDTPLPPDPGAASAPVPPAPVEAGPAPARSERIPAEVSAAPLSPARPGPETQA